MLDDLVACYGEHFFITSIDDDQAHIYGGGYSMTFTVPAEFQPIRVRLDERNRPVALFWGSVEYQIERISNMYRVPGGSLEEPECHDFYEITTSGWLMRIYHNLQTDEWGIEELWD